MSLSDVRLFFVLVVSKCKRLLVKLDFRRQDWGEDRTEIMKLHPADIARELKTFQFFRAFPEDLLLQVSTLVETASFSKGDAILSEGETNTKLFFMRNGYFEVVLAGEVVALLQNPGEVAGEMSVVTQKPASTMIRAGAQMDCFVLDSRNFGYVPVKERDHFLHLMYRIYSNILVDRLGKTNEKARLFEIANRELHHAQMALDKTGNKIVLLVETDRKQLALAKVAMGSTGVQLDTASDIEIAKTLLAEKKYDAVIADETCLELLKFAHASKYPGRLVMMTTKDVSSNLSTLKSMESIDTMMTRDPEDRSFTIRTILTTLTKVLSTDLFGCEKYLSWGVEIQSHPVRASIERERLREEMCGYFKGIGIRNTIIERVNTVTEELLMNAIYDAPTDSTGTAIYNHLSRKNQVILEPQHQSQLRYGSDGVFLAVSVVDPFGALPKDLIVRYLESNYKGEEMIAEHAGKGGAGRGLHMIVENSDLTIFNVKRGVRTEVVCLFHVEGHKRELSPSFHYFFM